MASLTVSIAMCTFNGGKFLEQQLQSIENQTRQPDELVVCDDGSKDRTLEILEVFAKTAPFPVRVIQNEKNLNYSKNFEKSASLCTKDIIFFADQDDIWAPEKIETVLKVFEENPNIGHVFHAFKRIDADGNPLPDSKLLFGSKLRYPFSYEEMAQLFEKDSTRIICYGCLSYSGCMYAYRRVFNNVLIPFFPEGGHDTWVMNVLGAISDTRFLPQPLISYRIHSANTSKIKRSKLQRLKLKIWRKWNRLTKQDMCRAIVRRISSQPVIRHPEIVDELKLVSHFYYRLTRFFYYFLGIRENYAKKVWLQFRNEKKNKS